MKIIHFKIIKFSKSFIISILRTMEIPIDYNESLGDPCDVITH